MMFAGEKSGLIIFEIDRWGEREDKKLIWRMNVIMQK